MDWGTHNAFFGAGEDFQILNLRDIEHSLVLHRDSLPTSLICSKVLNKPGAVLIAARQPAQVRSRMAM